MITKSKEFLTLKEIKILISLKSNRKITCKHDLVRMTDSTMTTVAKKIKKLEEKDLVFIINNSKKKCPYLTEKGNEVVDNLIKIKELLR